MAHHNPASNETEQAVWRFHRFVVHYPTLVMLISFVFAASLAGAAIGNNAFEPHGAWSDFSSIIVQRDYGFRVARFEWYKLLQEYGKWTIEPRESRRRLLEAQREGDTGIGEPARRMLASGSQCDVQSKEFQDASLILMFRDKGKNPMSAKTLSSIAQMQLGSAELAGFKELCQLNSAGECISFYSPVNWASFLGPSISTRPASSTDYSAAAKCMNINAAQFAKAADTENCAALYRLPIRCSAGSGLELPASSKSMEAPFRALCVNGTSAKSSCHKNYLLGAARDLMFAEQWDCETLAAEYTRIYLPGGAPLRGADCYSTDSEAYELKASALFDALFKLKKKVEDGNKDITVYFTFSDMSWFFNYYLTYDLLKLGLSIAIVFLVLWVQTSSLFITCMGLIQILISFPMGLFVWSIVLQEPGVTYLMYNGIFIILGIGCDDIFVFLDAFRQSKSAPPHISGSLETRFAWAYNRAASSMFSTSLTTCLAFAACAVSQIWDIRCFGVVNCFMVLFNYLLAITWFPAAVIVHEKYLSKCMPWCTPKTLGAKAYRKAKALSGSRRDPNALRLEAAPADSPGGAAGGAPPGAPPEQGPAEVFFAGVFADFILKYKVPLLAFFAVLVVGTTVTWTLLLVPASETFTFFDDSHYYQQVEKAAKKFKGAVNGEGSIAVSLAFGLDPNKPWSAGSAHPIEVAEEPLYVGTPQSAGYSAFDLFDHQESFSVACKAFHNEMISLGEAYPGGRYYCWTDEFKKWALQSKDTAVYPYTDRAKFLAATRSWLEAAHNQDPYSFQNVTTAHRKLYKESDTRFPPYASLSGFALAGTKVQFVFASFDTVLPIVDNGHPNARLWKLYRHMEAALAAAEQASGLRGGIQTSRTYHIMTLTTYLATSSIINMVAGMSIAVVIIFCVTRNIRLTVLASLALYTIISLVFSEMVIFGWQINLLEAIDISIASGMAVDYLLHLVHSYNHCTGSAEERFRSALGEMAVSVTSGAFTTFMACIALFLCDMLWFKLFGCFIAMVVLSSYFTSMVGLQALLAHFGEAAPERGPETLKHAEPMIETELMAFVEPAQAAGSAFDKKQVSEL